MIDTQILRTLYVDTKDVQPQILEHAIHKINCRKEELKYVSYDFFDNTTVAILTNKQIVFVETIDNQIKVKTIRYLDVRNVGYEMLEDRLKISLSDKHHNVLAYLPTSTYKNSTEMIEYIYNTSMQSRNQTILKIFKK